MARLRQVVRRGRPAKKAETNVKETKISHTYIPCGSGEMDIDNSGGGMSEGEDRAAAVGAEALDEGSVDWNLEMGRAIAAAEKQHGLAVRPEHVFELLHAKLTTNLAHRAASASCFSTGTAILGHFPSDSHDPGSPPHSRASSPHPPIHGSSHPEGADVEEADQEESDVDEDAAEKDPEAALNFEESIRGKREATDVPQDGKVELSPEPSSPLPGNVEADGEAEAKATAVANPVAELKEGAADGEGQGEGEGAGAGIEDQKMDNDAAEVLLMFGTQKYKADDLGVEAAEGSGAAAAPEPPAAPEVPGIRTSKRKRQPNIRVVSDLEPSIEEQNWGKGRGRRGKQALAKGAAAALQNAVKGGRMKKGFVDPYLAHLFSQHQLAQHMAMPATGPPVTLEVLRALRDSGRKLDGLELLVMWMGLPPAQRVWYPVKLVKSDLDFKKVVMRYTASGQVETFNFHNENMQHMITFPLLPTTDMHHPAHHMAGPGMNLQQFELLRQFKMSQMAQMSQALGLGGPGFGSMDFAQLAAFGGGGGFMDWAAAAQAHGNMGGPWNKAAAGGKDVGASTRAKSTPTRSAGAVTSARGGKASASASAIARALGLDPDDVVADKNPQVKVTAGMFDALRENLKEGCDKIMCKVTAADKGSRTAVLTGVASTGGLRVKYLDAQQPLSGTITEEEVLEEDVELEITQVVPITE